LKLNSEDNKLITNLREEKRLRNKFS